MKVFAALFCSCVLAFGQTKSSASLQTKGDCSPVITGSGNVINIKTCNLSPPESDQLRNLLRSIINNQRLGTATIIKKLDACLQGMEGRHLTKEQRVSILAVIEAFPNTKIDIRVPLGDSEARAYALDFVDLFREAKWKLIEGDGMAELMGGGIYTTGLVMSVRASSIEEATKLYTNEKTPEVFKLFSVLTKNDILYVNHLGIDKNLAPNAITLDIGVKPDSHSSR